MTDFSAEVRAADRNAYLATLFAPEAARPALFALTAYGIELDRIVRRAREPLAAEVRLQWWRDAIRAEGFGADAADVPLVGGLHAAMAAYGWPADTLAAMSEARIHDLYADPFETLDEFDGHAGEAFAAPLQLAAMAVAAETRGGEAGVLAARTAAVAAGHGGVALSAAEAVFHEPERLAAGRTHVPRAVWREVGTADLEAALSEGRAPEGTEAALRAMIVHGRSADASFRAALAGVDAGARAALLPAFAARPLLNRAAARPMAPRRPGPFAAQWRLWRDARSLSRG